MRNDFKRRLRVRGPKIPMDRTTTNMDDPINVKTPGTRRVASSNLARGAKTFQINSLDLGRASV